MTTKATKIATKKKTATKKAAAAPTKAKSTAGVSPDATIRIVEGSRQPRMPKRQAIKKAVPASGIKASALVEKTGCTLRTVAAMIRLGFFEVRA